LFLLARESFDDGSLFRLKSLINPHHFTTPV